MKRRKPDQPHHPQPNVSPVAPTERIIELHVPTSSSGASVHTQGLADAAAEASKEATVNGAEHTQPRRASSLEVDRLIEEGKQAANDERTPATMATKRVAWHQPIQQTTAYMCSSALPAGGARKASNDVAREKEAATGLPLTAGTSIMSRDNDDSNR